MSRLPNTQPQTFRTPASILNFVLCEKPTALLLYESVNLVSWVRLEYTSSHARTKFFNKIKFALSTRMRRILLGSSQDQGNQLNSLASYFDPCAGSESDLEPPVGSLPTATGDRRRVVAIGFQVKWACIFVLSSSGDGV
jgi:hypothetical protein